MSDPLKLEHVTLETLCGGRLRKDFEDYLELAVFSLETSDERYDPKAPREIVMKVSITPDGEGGAATAYKLDVKIPMAQRSRKTHAHIGSGGKLTQFAAEQGELELPRNVTKFRSPNGEEQ